MRKYVNDIKTCLMQSDRYNCLIPNNLHIDGNVAKNITIRLSFIGDEKITFPQTRFRRTFQIIE